MPTDPLTKVLRGPTMVESVVGQLEALIFQGELPKGHRLPAERPLCLRLGVSRTVLREAVSALVAKGLLVPLPGGGYEVASPTFGAVAQSLTMFLRSGEPHIDYAAVHEVRRMLEVENARIGAQRRTQPNLSQMQECLSRMQSALEPFDGEAYALADVDFHLAIAASTQNPLLWLLLETLTDLMKDVRRIGAMVAGSSHRGLQHHQLIFNAIQAKDAEGAERAMTLHLQESQEIVLAAMARLKDVHQPSLENQVEPTNK